MIEIKQIGLIQQSKTYILNDTILNGGSSYSFIWNNKPVLFVFIENNASIAFNNLNIFDNSGQHLIHTAQTRNVSYSICFAGDGTAQPTSNTRLPDLSNLTFDWNFAGLAIGSVTIKIFYLNL